MSSSGADQHLLALLRAIRLRQAAPDAVAAGAADAAAALTDDDPAGLAGGRALPAGEHREALPPGPSSSPHEDDDHGPSMRPRWAGAGAFGREAKAQDDSTRAHDDSARPGAAEQSAETSDRYPNTSDKSGQVGRSFWQRGPAPEASRPAASPPADPHSHIDLPAVPEDEPRYPTNPPLPPPVIPPGAALARRAGSSVSRRSDAEPEPADTERPPVERAPQVRPRNLGVGPVRRPEPAPEKPPAAEPPPVRPGFTPWRKAAPPNRPPGLPMTHIGPPTVGRPPAESAHGDGMDPADDFLLRETQRLLATSLTFAGGPDDVAERFHTAMLQAEPETLDALPGNARTQIGIFSAALTWLVHHLDQPPKLVAGCARLGTALAACEIDLHRPHMVGPALAEAMRAGMPPGAWRQDFDLAWRSTWQHAYDWIRHGAADRQPRVWDAIVAGHEIRRPGLAVLTLRPTLPMPFRPGQHALVETAALPGEWRPQAFAVAPHRTDLVELHVRTGDRAGDALVHRTLPGDRVRIGAAEGDLTLSAPPGSDLLLIAADTGIAPIKSLLTELADTGDPRSVTLFWGVRQIPELYDLEAVTRIASVDRRATVVPVVAEGNPGPYASGTVTEALAALGDWQRHEVYLAGPPAALDPVVNALLLHGVPSGRMHYER